MNQPSGIFLVNKPKGVSSNQLIQEIKHRLKVKKIGHAGTLDPLAEGLMIVLVNQATKLSSLLLNENKRYLGIMQLFSRTNTGDEEGEIAEKKEPFSLSLKVVKSTFNKFNNYEYYQEVPNFSAVKVKGKKLYQYARNQEKINLPRKKIKIKDLKLVRYDEKNHQIEFDTRVSKGTYIRSLIEDIAKDLGTIGHLKQLIRTESGNFKINKAQKIQNINWDDLINLYDTLTLATFPVIKYKDSWQDILEGKPITLPSSTPSYVFIANENKEILAYYGLGQDGLYHCLRGGFNNY